MKASLNFNRSLLDDLRGSFASPGFWGYSAWLGIALRYRATALGPLWLVMSTMLFVLLLGNLYQIILNAPPGTYILHLATGYVLWLFIQQILLSSCSIYKTDQSFVMNGNARLTDFLLKQIASSSIILLHNAIVVIGVFIFSAAELKVQALLAIPGMLLLLINAFWIAVVFSIVGARYRDLREILQALMRIFFLATPVIWMPQLSSRTELMGPFLTFNPFYHALEVIRAPLMGFAPDPVSFYFMGTAAVVGTALAFWAYRRYGPYVPLWL